MFRLSLCCSVSLLTVGCIEQHINPFPNESDPAVTCDVVPNASSDVEINGECDTPLLHLEDPWDVAVEWQWQGSAADPDVANVISTPVIVHLTDDNLDGRIDSSDIPDIAFVAYDSWMSAGVLVAVDGASGQTLWRSEPGLYAPSGLAAGDVDGDGVSELLGYFVEGFINVRVIAFDHDGQAMWLSEDTLPIVGTTVGSIGNPFPLLTVADLEGDESMEVIMDRLVLDGRDGSTKFALNLEDGDTIRTVSTADMDLDGEREIILGNSVFGADGALLWTAPLQTIEGLAVAWNAVVDVDEDPEGELVVVGGGELSVFEPDGTEISRANIGTIQESFFPCVADFDGDGEPEIALGFNSAFQAFEMDGTVLWTSLITNNTGGAGCSGFDFNADGAIDVVFADETAVRIFDGRTGDMVYTWQDHGSGTAMEYPTLADVDQDGSVEIIVASDLAHVDGNGGVTVLGHEAGTWLPGGTTWPVHDFSPAAFGADGQALTAPAHPWQRHNMVRARPTLAVDDPLPIADLQVEITDVCAEVCTDGGWQEEAAVILAAQVRNTGMYDTANPSQLHLYALDGDEVIYIDSVEIGPVPAGKANTGVVFALSADQVGPDGLRLEIEPAVGDAECATDNNTATWSLTC